MSDLMFTASITIEVVASKLLSKQHADLLGEALRPVIEQHCTPIVIEHLRPLPYGKMDAQINVLVVGRVRGDGADGSSQGGERGSEESGGAS